MLTSTAVPAASRTGGSSVRRTATRLFTPVERLEDRRLFSAASLAAAAASGRVTGFTLINPGTDRAVTTLRNGSVIDLSSLPNGRLNVRADTSPGTVGSVRFFLDGAPEILENTRPYALFGDNGNDFLGQTLSPGRHTIRAVPFSGVSGRGAQGEARTISVTVVDTRPAPLPMVSGFSLIDPESGDVVSALNNGDEIDLADFSGGNFSVRANTSPATVGSVRFGLDDDPNVQTENTAPYSLFGNAGGQFEGGTLAEGEYTLLATAFTGRNATGRGGVTRTVRFTVTDSSSVATELQIFMDGVNPATGQSIEAARNNAIEEGSELVTGDLIDFGDVPQSGPVLIRIKNPGPAVTVGDFVIGPDDVDENGAAGDTRPSVAFGPREFDPAFVSGALEIGNPQPPDDNPVLSPEEFREEGNSQFVIRTVVMRQEGNPEALDFVITIHEPTGTPGSRPPKVLDQNESLDILVNGQTPGGANGSTAPSQGGRRRRLRGRTRAG